MGLGRLLLRLAVGATFFVHGTQKLFGWFGGYGPQGTGGFFASQGYRYGVPMAVLAGLAEAGGGVFLALGLLTPLACAAIAIVMLNAIFAVTLKRGFLLGSELELMYLVTVVALAAIGPGRFSLDRAIGWDDTLSGLECGIVVAVAAALVSAGTMVFFHSKPAPQAATAE
jgi:putative oxidoreductase